MLIEIFKAIILGIIEGLTEFIPVSSTGHLILAGDFLTFTTANTATFDIAIQLGAILAVVVLYKDFFRDLFKPKNWFSKESINILIAITPALLAGFLAHSYIKKYLFSSFTVAIGLLVGAILMIIAQLRHKTAMNNTNSVQDITMKQAFTVGCFQCLALWPGMSRSGSTIIGGLVSKMNYEISAKFSFIIAVPVMVAAVSYDLLKSAASLTLNDLFLIFIGFIISFFIAILAIKWFLNILKKFKLIPFAAYRIVLSLIIFLILS